MLVSDAQQNDSHMHIYSIYIYTYIFIYTHVHASCFSRVWLFGTPWTAAHQAPLSMGFSRQKLVEWVAMPSSRASFWPRDWTRVFCVAGGFFTRWVIREAFIHRRAHTHTHILLQILFHYRLLQDTEYSFLCYTVGPCWLSIFCIVMCIY